MELEPAASISPGRRTAITIVVMCATLMTMLDSTIAIVALPYMQTSLGANQDQINWVLTSYMIASALVIPATGYLESRLGRRVFFTGALTGFIISSALCGLAGSLNMMVMARIIQGACGAAIAPLGQSILLDSYVKAEHPKAVSIWGLGIMVGPILGPVVGGWLTDSFDWRWVFMVNLPIGVFAIIGSWALVKSAPTEKRRFDLTGYGLIALGLASLQLALDRGTGKDWFHSTEIVLEVLIAVAALWMFVIHQIFDRNPLFPRAVWTDRNFVSSCIILMTGSGAMMGGAAIAVPMLQGLYGYGPIQAGLLSMPRGIAMAISMFAVGLVSNKIDPRIILGTGLTLAAIGMLGMSRFSVDASEFDIIWTGALQGIGLGMTFIRLTLLAYSTLPADMRLEAATITALGRSLSASVVIAIVTALTARNVQINHEEIGGSVTEMSLPGIHSGILEQMGIRGDAILGGVDMEVNRQAAMISYINDYWVMGWALVLLLPIVLIVKPTGGTGAQARGIVEAH
jgi:DHA2 family multidrug resistance protein